MYNKCSSNVCHCRSMMRVEIEEEQLVHAECLLKIHHIEQTISGRLLIFLVVFTDVAAPLSDLSTCDFKSGTEDSNLLSSNENHLR